MIYQIRNKSNNNIYDKSMSYIKGLSENIDLELSKNLIY